MRTTVFIALIALTASSLNSCKAKPQMSDRQACEVIKRLLYPNCRFKFSPEEVAALSEENRIKIDSAKRFFRTCPQIEECKK